MIITNLIIALALSQSVCFEPGGQCTEEIIRTIDRAKTSIRVSAYSFTSDEIAHALIEAHKRGVRVTVIVDARRITERQSKILIMSRQGLAIFADRQHKSSHNKVMVIDEQKVITGSLNFTDAAKSNAENTVIIHSRELAAKYTKNFNDHQNHSKPVAGGKD